MTDLKFGISLFLAVLAAAAPGAAPAQESPPAETWRRVSPFWTSARGRLTTVHLHNNLIDEALTVTPVFYLEDGSRVEGVRPLTLAPLGNAEIDVNALMASLGLADRFGGAEFQYHREYDGALGVETEVLAPADTLAYSVVSFVPSDRDSNEQHGLFWLPTPQAEIFFAVHNASDQRVTVRPEIQFGDGAGAALKPLNLPPRGFAKMRLDSRSLPERGEAGSVTLRHDGPAGAVRATGWTDDEHTGFSAMMSFTDPGLARAHTLYGTQIFLGRHEALAALGGGAKVDSRLLLKNMSGIATTANAEIFHSRNGAAGVTPLALGTIPAGATRTVDFSRLQKDGLIPAEVQEASVVVRHSGKEGALTGRLIGVSADKTFGFVSVLEGYLGGHSSNVYWTTEGDRDSVITVANFGEESDEVTIELAYAGGTAALPSFRLEPNASRTVNVRDFARLLPEGQAGGGYSVSGTSKRSSRLLTKQQVISRQEKFALPFYGSITYAIGLVIEPFFPQTVTLSIGESWEFYVTIIWSDGSDELAFWADTSVSDSHVAELNPDSTFGHYTVTAQSPGNAEIRAQSLENIDPFGGRGFIMAQARPLDSNCAVGVTSISANALTSTTGNVKFTVTNFTCPSGGGNQVRVGVAPIDIQGLTIEDWTPQPPVNVSVPSAGSATPDQTLNFSVSGTGSTKFRVLIDQCNGQMCDNVDWDISPNKVDTNTVSFSN